MLASTEMAGAGKADSALGFTGLRSLNLSWLLTSPPVKMTMRVLISKLSPSSYMGVWKKVVKALGLLARKMLSNYHSHQDNPGSGPSYLFFIYNHMHIYTYTLVHTYAYECTHTYTVDVHTYTYIHCTQYTLHLCAHICTHGTWICTHECT